MLITAASSSAGLAAIETVKAQQAIAIATTRERDKREELLAAGADHVIVTGEEDLVARVKAITNGAGARLIFDPIAGPLLEKLAEAAAQGAMIIEYGWLSLGPTRFPVVPALTKALNICGYWLTETVYNPEKFARAKKYVYDRIKGGHFRPRIAKTLPLRGRRRSVSIPGIKSADRKGRTDCRRVILRLVVELASSCSAAHFPIPYGTFYGQRRDTKNKLQGF